METQTRWGKLWNSYPICKPQTPHHLLQRGSKKEVDGGFPRTTCQVNSKTTEKGLAGGHAEETFNRRLNTAGILLPASLICIRHERHLHPRLDDNGCRGLSVYVGSANVTAAADFWWEQYVMSPSRVRLIRGTKSWTSFFETMTWPPRSRWR
jgi:hypothetical protein